VSVSKDQTIRIWNAQSGQKVQSWQGQWSIDSWDGSIAFSPNGTQIAFSSNKVIWLYNLVSGAWILLQGHNGCIRSLKFSPDGGQIVSGSEDTTIRIWDVMSGTEVLSPLRGHMKPVRSVAFSQDGTQIVSVSKDQTIRIWNAICGIEVLPPLWVKDDGGWPGFCEAKFSSNGTQIMYRFENVAGVSDTLSNIASFKATHTLHTSFASGSQISQEHYIHVDAKGWIVNSITNEVISKVPAIFWSEHTILGWRLFAGETLMISMGTRGGHVVIMHFPLHLHGIRDNLMQGGD